MKGQWKEVARLAFKGERFRDHALDVAALTELSRFQKIATETAKALWRAANPGRERLPKRFEERTRLCLRAIEEGSAVAPLEVFMEEPAQGEIFEQEPTEIIEAIDLTQEALRAVEQQKPLPQKFPKALLREYEKWGAELAGDEAIEISTNGKKTARINPLLRERLSQLIEGTHSDQVNISGEVLEADVRQKRFQLWLDEKTCVTASFSPEQESQVTEALRQHQTLRLQVSGQGEFSPLGRPLRITKVDDLSIQALGQPEYDSSVRPIEEILKELAREVPEEDWRRLPADLTDNLDHYIYGTPK